MASHNFSFIVVTPEEFENCRKASDGAATTASLPVIGAACKPPRKFLAPVDVVSKLKKKKYRYRIFLKKPRIFLKTLKPYKNNQNPKP